MFTTYRNRVCIFFNLSPILPIITCQILTDRAGYCHMSLRMDAGFEHLREAMANVFAERIEFPIGAFVTILKAKMTANTAHASFTISVLPTSMEAAVMKTLEQNTHELKDGLAHSLRLRRIPRLHFAFDHTEEHAAQIDGLLNKLEAEGQIDLSDKQ